MESLHWEGKFEISKNKVLWIWRVNKIFDLSSPFGKRMVLILDSDLTYGDFSFDFLCKRIFCLCCTSIQLIKSLYSVMELLLNIAHIS